MSVLGGAEAPAAEAPAAAEETMPAEAATAHAEEVKEAEVEGVGGIVLSLQHCKMEHDKQGANMQASNTDNNKGERAHTEDNGCASGVLMEIGRRDAAPYLGTSSIGASMMTPPELQDEGAAPGYMRQPLCLQSSGQGESREWSRGTQRRVLEVKVEARAKQKQAEVTEVLGDKRMRKKKRQFGQDEEDGAHQGPTAQGRETLSNKVAQRMISSSKNADTSTSSTSSTVTPSTATPSSSASNGLVSRDRRQKRRSAQGAQGSMSKSKVARREKETSDDAIQTYDDAIHSAPAYTAAGASCEILFDGEWWAARVVARSEHTVRVSYVGGTEEDDEWIQDLDWSTRIRSPVEEDRVVESTACYDGVEPAPKGLWTCVVRTRPQHPHAGSEVETISKPVVLGTFTTAREAAQHYDCAMLELFQDSDRVSCRLNLESSRAYFRQLQDKGRWMVLDQLDAATRTLLKESLFANAQAAGAQDKSDAGVADSLVAAALVQANRASANRASRASAIEHLPSATVHLPSATAALPATAASATAGSPWGACGSTNMDPEAVVSSGTSTSTSTLSLGSTSTSTLTLGSQSLSHSGWHLDDSRFALDGARSASAARSASDTRFSSLPLPESSLLLPLTNAPC